MAHKNNLTIQEYELPILAHADESGGFIAQCKNWTDCYAQGDTLEEALNEISYVASSLIELYQEEGIKIPLTLKKTKKQSLMSLRFTFPLIVSGNSS